MYTLTPTLASEPRLLTWTDEPEWFDRNTDEYDEAYSAFDPEGLTECTVTYKQYEGAFFMVKATSALSETPEVQDAGAIRTVTGGINRCERVVRDIYARRAAAAAPAPTPAADMEGLEDELAAMIADAAPAPAEPAVEPVADEAPVDPGVDIPQFIHDYVQMLDESSEGRPAKRKLVKEIRDALAERGVEITLKAVEFYL